MITRKILRIDTIIDRCADCIYFREPNQYSGQPYCAMPRYPTIPDPDSIPLTCPLEDEDTP